MAEIACPNCEKLRQRIAELEARLEAALRAGKRQAAPFAKGPPKSDPKKPGRKPGDDYGTKAHRPAPPPEQIDEVHEAPLPHHCPDCGGRIDETGVAQQFQVEIPRRPIHRQFNIHIGCCRACQRRVQGRHPLQTSDAIGAAASQLGGDAQAAIVSLNKEAGLSHGKVRTVLNNLFGIKLSRGGSAHTILRAARRCNPIHQALSEAMPQASTIYADETGWRVGGLLAWMHTLVAPQATIYAIDPTRSSNVAKNLLGLDFAGILGHDGWAPYDCFTQATHQQCLAHLLRRCERLEENAVGGAVLFPRRIHEHLLKALDLRDRFAAGQLSTHGLAIAAGRLHNQLVDLIWPTKTNPANETFARFLWNHLDSLLTFLKVPGVQATNWLAEHAIRFGVVLRKVWGGNRTWIGANAQAVLMTFWRTCQQQGRAPLDTLSQLLRGHPIVLQPP